jgi:hypothetical protein
VALVAPAALVERLAIAAAGYVGQYGETVGLSHQAALRLGYGLAADGRAGQLVVAAARPGRAGSPATGPGLVRFREAVRPSGTVG